MAAYTAQPRPLVCKWPDRIEIFCRKANRGKCSQLLAVTQRREMKDLELNCLLCFSFITSQAVANTPNIDKQVQCDACSHLFGSKKIYIEHKKTCNPPLFSPEKTVPCDHCTEKFFNKGALAKHKEQCHN